MRLRPWIPCFVLLLISSFASAASVRPDLTPEIVKRCKLATALVRVVDEEEGTAFHIGDGVFLTNHHVIEGAAGGAKIEIVLNAGEKTQKVVTARVARADKTVDLAMLKIDEKELPPALEIGDTSDLVETMSVAVFGFPFGTDLAVGKNEFPSISVNIGRITALRKAEGNLDSIQTDTPVSPGNSGGPLIDGKGQVIGVIQAHVPGANLTFAIPADRVRKFLFGTGILLRVTPLQLTPGAMSNLSIEVVAQKKEGSPEPSVSMRLSAFAQDQREYKLASDGKGLYTVQAPLIPTVETDDLNADIEEQGEQWSIRVKDQSVQVAGRSLKLSGIKVITQGVGSSIELASGQRLAGTVAGLKSVACIRNGKPGTIDLSRAPMIRLSRPSSSSSKVVNYEIFVRNGPNVVASQKGTIAADGVHPEIARVGGEEREPAKTPDTTTNLPADIPCVRWARNGHYYAAVVLDRTLRWTEAMVVASKLRYMGKRGHLVTLSSAEENAFIVQQFPPSAKLGYWLGGYQDREARDYSEPSGGWRWVTGEPWRFAAWNQGEPNNAGDEHFLEMGGGATWNDLADPGGADRLGFIVEFE